MGLHIASNSRRRILRVLLLLAMMPPITVWTTQAALRVSATDPA